MFGVLASWSTASRTFFARVVETRGFSFDAFAE